MGTVDTLLIAILIGLIPAAVASSKGHNFFAWWLYGAALFIVALPHALVITADREAIERRQMAEGMRKCPFCAEMIKAEATVCRYCGRELEQPCSPDESLVASGSVDRTVKLWEVGTGREVMTLAGHRNSLWSVAFSPDGSLLGSASVDKTVKLWEVGTGREVRTLAGHKGSVNSVAFSPDGSLLASGSYDKTVKLWEVGRGSG